LPRADSAGFVDLRMGSPARGGTYPYDGDDLVTPWHHHDLHEVLYAQRGAIEVETDAAHYLLPPQQAAWIPAGLSHRTTIRTHVRSIAVLLAPPLVPGPGRRARIVAVAPLLQEMMAFGVRWPIDRAETDPLADRFFEVFAGLVATALDQEAPLSLPTSQHPLVRAAMTYTKEHLDDVDAVRVAAAVNVSGRTLRRLFDTQVGMTWRRYLLQARLLQAIALLSEPGPSVMDVSTGVGFESVSAFTRAFARHTGETPAAYRNRVCAAPTDAGGPAPARR
jgi:AraC-like DNA-binding protein